MRTCILLLGFFPLCLAGCAGNPSAPRTAEDYRLEAIGSDTSVQESFEVNRTFESVVGTFKRKAPQCLDMAGSWRQIFMAGRDKAELHVLTAYANGARGKGEFVMVVDIAPASLRKTRIDIYRDKQGVNALLKAVKSWATGKDIICPDIINTNT